MCLLVTPMHSQADVASTRYSIVLASAPGTDLRWIPKKSSLLDGRTLYVQETMVNRLRWERLCLGFFDSREQALSLLKEIKLIYHDAWIQRASENDIKRTISKAPIVSPVSKQAPKGKKPNLTDEQLDSLMQRAKSDFKNKNYSSAIRYLTALVTSGEHKYSREALELLGLARQRKGQNAHAADTYEKYLALYPDGEESDRVRQRLAGLITATKSPRDKIRMATEENVDKVTTYGSFSQNYRNNRSSTSDTGSVTNLSQLMTFLDLTTIQMSSEYDHRYQFTSDHIYDFLDDDENSEFRFTEAFYEFNYRKTGSSGIIGRQSLRIGGLRKRFDGLSGGYQFTPDMRFNILGGFPVEIADKNSINEHKTFYGLTFETGTFFEYWEMTPFYFDQKVDGVDDRNSTGTEVRYRDDNTTLFSMIDYDLLYKEVNIFQFNANLMFDHGRTAYMSAFLSKSPVLSTSNALIGRPETTIDELKKTLNIEQIYQLARDRTADSKTITIGGSQQLNKKYQVTADITLSEIDNTIASGGVAAVPGTGTTYFINTNLVGNNIFMERDTGVLGIRYIDTEPQETISLIANSRFPITRNWRINPRLQFDFRKLKDGRSQEKIRAIFRTDYRYLNKARFDFEVGYDETTDDSNNLGSNNLFFTLGYRWDF